jgi:hypothetical protein
MSQYVAHPDLTAAPLVYSASPSGLSPSQVRQAYGINQVTFQNGTVAGTGAGQTIAIVTAYDDPNIGADLKAFDRQYGIADAPSFIKYVQTGMTQSDAGWSLETSLDVEWAHSIAPGANIVLVEAKSADINDLFGAVNFARSLSGVVAVSMSWGTSEFYGQWNYDPILTTPAGHVGGSGLPGGITFVAASGDTGAWSGLSYPSSSVNVLSVGSTSLNLGANASYGGEQGWIGSTGGFSAIEPVPAYQTSTQAATGLHYGFRTTPDVSIVGDPSTGVSVYDTVPYGGRIGWATVGGTSASAPQWAGLVAVADQGLALAGKGSIANAQAAVYQIPATAFHNVSSGFNGYSATTGYNLVTGLGSPVATGVVAGLLATQNVYNVTGFPAPALPHSQIVASARLSVTFSPSDVTSTGVNTGQGSTGATGSAPVFPVFPPNIVVVVVPFGARNVLVFFPPAFTTSPLFASTNRPVQNLVTPLVSLPAPGPTSLSQFGQEPSEAFLIRPVRFTRETELAMFIDVVEPFKPPGAADPAPMFLGSRTTLGTQALGLSGILPRIDLGSKRDDSREERVPQADRVAVPPMTEVETKSRASGSSSALAGAAVLAAGGYWLTLRDRQARRAEQPWASRRSERSFKPGLRRFSLPPR